MAYALLLLALTAGEGSATDAKTAGRLPTVKKTWKEKNVKEPAADSEYCNPGPWDFSKLSFKHARGKVQIAFEVRTPYALGETNFNSELDPNDENLTLAEQALTYHQVRMVPNPSKKASKWGGADNIVSTTTYRTNAQGQNEPVAGLRTFRRDASGGAVLRWLGKIEVKINGARDTVTIKFPIKLITKKLLAKDERLKKLALGASVGCSGNEGPGDVIPGGTRELASTSDGTGEGSGSRAVVYLGDKKMGIVKFRRGRR